METELEQGIRSRLAVIMGRVDGDLSEAVGYLDRVKDKAPGHLGHYLQKRSYEKAWIHLEGDQAEAGSCGR